MDILLATPVNKTHYSTPPLGLGYLVSALRKAGIDSVSLLDSVRENLDINRFRAFLKVNKPKVLGIQCYSFDVPAVKRMLTAAKEIDPGIITIIGGPHPTAVKEEVFSEFTGLDFAFQGEAEESLFLFIKAVLGHSISLDGIHGLIFKENGKIRVNPAKLINDLDCLDMPAWEMMDPRSYPDVVQGGFYKDFPVAPVITSRGCPCGCSFCANRILMGRGLRLRSIDKVIGEIERLARDYQVKEVHILDDNFTVSKKRTLDFCQKFKSSKMKMHFAFPNGVRLDTLDREVLTALKEIGVYSITAGIESGSQRILDHMKKELTLDLIKEKARLIKSFGFILNAFFIMGYPAETKEDIVKTIKFARQLPLDAAHFSCFLPLPGTDITQELLNSGQLKKIDYTQLFYSKAAFSPDGISRKELKALQRKAFLSFYLRPRVLYAMILRLKSPRHFNSIIRRLIDYIFSSGNS